ncbi:MAG: heme A synthase [Bacteroidetes bacterium]|nr:heme A synthase [Bacteroidota bacterium]
MPFLERLRALLQGEDPAPSAAYRAFAWGSLGYTILVVLWGAFVRATGSGAGCGDHWPLCNGEVVPRSPALETIIELSHRLSSALVGFLIIGLVVWTFRLYQKGHIQRKLALWSLFFVITEGLIGAGLVLFELVADDTSMARVYSIVLHLINTFILLAVMSLLSFRASGILIPRIPRDRRRWMGLALVVTLIVIGATGAVTALGDTLFRADSLAEGLSRKFASDAHLLEQLRIVHPAVAVMSWLLLVYSTMHIRSVASDPRTRTAAEVVMGLYVFQLALGLINVLLLAPVWMQLVHLAFADLLWVSTLLLVTYWFSDPSDPT